MPDIGLDPSTPFIYLLYSNIQVGLVKDSGSKDGENGKVEVKFRITGLADGGERGKEDSAWVTAWNSLCAI